MSIAGRNYAWERVRYLSRTLADHSMRRKVRAFQPGDIACCHGSIERAFCRHLQALGIPLEPWEGDKPFKQPLRFCVINKAFDDGYYEVFLMTTFGQARKFEDLGPLAQTYGIPVGGMNWVENIEPIRTYPPSFGWEGKSFIFAIPVVVRDIIPMASRWLVRLVSGELPKLRKISNTKIMNAYRVHRVVRRSLKYRHKCAPSADDEQDDFLPTEEVEDVVEMEREDLPPLPTPVPSVKSKRFPLPIRHNLSWLLDLSSYRIYNYSTYLNHRGMYRKEPIQLRLEPVTINSEKQRHSPIPKPYYSPYLRMNIKAISRIVR